MIAAADEVITTLDAEPEIALLRARLDRWLTDADPELHEALGWALAGHPKHYRPLTVFCCRRAAGAPVTDQTVELAFADQKQHRGLRRFTSRGLRRAKCQVGMLVLVHNGLIVQEALSKHPTPSTEPRPTA